jgi:tRNA G18 (ribose-2'-O)-methylase SpoU/Xaa-Pro aminopeptidase
MEVRIGTTEDFAEDADRTNTIREFRVIRGSVLLFGWFALSHWNSLQAATLCPMPRIPVDDAADPRLADYQQLNQQNPARWSGYFIAEGDKIAERLIASRYPVQSVLLIPEYAERFAALVSAETPLYVGSRQLLEATIGFNFHRGVLACGRRLPPLSLAETLSATADRATVVVCHDLKDPTNLGSILRTSAALGVRAVVLGPHCADYLSRRVVRVSMAAALQLPIVVAADVGGALARLKREFEFELVATVVDPAAEPLAKARRAAKMALVLGGEAHGLSPEVIAACDRRVTIPMRPGIDSLNVAVAAAVFLFHFGRSPAATGTRSAGYTVRRPKVVCRLLIWPPSSRQSANLVSTAGCCTISAAATSWPAASSASKMSQHGSRRWFTSFRQRHSAQARPRIETGRSTICRARSGSICVGRSWNKGCSRCGGDEADRHGISSRNSNPYVSRVDAGVVELVRFGPWVDSSGDLIQLFEATWDDDQWQMHLAAARVTDAAYGVAWKLIADRTRGGGSVLETEVQRAILDHFAANHVTTYSPPIVGAGAHSGDPHFETSTENDAPIREGEFVLIDLWGKLDKPRAVYSDLTRVGFVGREVPETYQKIFQIVAAARDAAIARVRERFAEDEPLQGWEVDEAARDVIDKAGYGEYFIHRTGHSIGQETHGNGANMDNLETHEERLVLRRTCFSIEPGIYLPDFGVRSEVNVFIDSGGQVHVTGGVLQRSVLAVS